MARPDLDAIERRRNVMNAPHWFVAWPWEKIYRHGNKDLSDLLTYCREMEAENKRLRLDSLVNQAQHTIDTAIEDAGLKKAEQP